jgi:hypothetical protein
MQMRKEFYNNNNNNKKKSLTIKMAVLRAEQPRWLAGWLVLETDD